MPLFFSVCTEFLTFAVIFYQLEFAFLTSLLVLHIKILDRFKRGKKEHRKNPNLSTNLTLRNGIVPFLYGPVGADAGLDPGINLGGFPEIILCRGSRGGFSPCRFLRPRGRGCASSLLLTHAQQRRGVKGVAAEGDGAVQQRVAGQLEHACQDPGGTRGSPHHVN
jgi:hypothetical protein